MTSLSLSPLPTLCELSPVFSNHLSLWKKCLTAPPWLVNIFWVCFHLKWLTWYSYSWLLRLEMFCLSEKFYKIILVRNHWRFTIWAQICFSRMILVETHQFFFRWLLLWMRSKHLLKVKWGKIFSLIGYVWLRCWDRFKWIFDLSIFDD